MNLYVSEPMILYHIIILAVIQGLTEFLPVSSSGHLGLFHCFADQCDHWDENNLIMDISVHVGTLFAVLVYFWRDILRMLMGLKDIGTKNAQSDDAKLLQFVLVSSIPVIIAGLVLHMFEPDWLKTLYVIAWTTLIFGVVLWYADTKTSTTKEIKDMTYKDALLVGLAQILALIPGTSRSGITMTASRFLGYSRTDSAHYSMLLAMVAISGAGALIGLDLVEKGDVQLGFDALLGTVLSFISGWIALAVMMKFLQRFTFTVFAVYRVILGGGLLILLYSGTITG
tara:strand:+ start:416 stop:1267 length:852 start_codon:yes stop_codon:yes gene_type:complete